MSTFDRFGACCCNPPSGEPTLDIMILFENNVAMNLNGSYWGGQGPKYINRVVGGGVNWISFIPPVFVNIPGRNVIEATPDFRATKAELATDLITEILRKIKKTNLQLKEKARIWILDGSTWTQAYLCPTTINQDVSGNYIRNTFSIVHWPLYKSPENDITYNSLLGNSIFASDSDRNDSFSSVLSEGVGNGAYAAYAPVFSGYTKDRRLDKTLAFVKGLNFTTTNVGLSWCPSNDLEQGSYFSIFNDNDYCRIYKSSTSGYLVNTEDYIKNGNSWPAGYGTVTEEFLPYFTGDLLDYQTNPVYNFDYYPRIAESEKNKIKFRDVRVGVADFADYNNKYNQQQPYADVCVQYEQLEGESALQSFPLCFPDCQTDEDGCGDNTNSLRAAVGQISNLNNYKGIQNVTVNEQEFRREGSPNQFLYFINQDTYFKDTLGSLQLTPIPGNWEEPPKYHLNLDSQYFILSNAAFMEDIIVGQVALLRTYGEWALIETRNTVGLVERNPSEQLPIGTQLFGRDIIPAERGRRGWVSGSALEAYIAPSFLSRPRATNGLYVGRPTIQIFPNEGKGVGGILLQKDTEAWKATSPDYDDDLGNVVRTRNNPEIISRGFGYKEYPKLSYQSSIGSNLIFSEDFSDVSLGINRASNFDNVEWSAFNGNYNFPFTNNAYQADGAIMLSGSQAYIETRNELFLDFPFGGTFTVSVDVKGWQTIEGFLEIKVKNSVGNPNTVVYSSAANQDFITYYSTFNSTTGTALIFSPQINPNSPNEFTESGRLFLTNIKINAPAEVPAASAYERGWIIKCEFTRNFDNVYACLPFVRASRGLTREHGVASAQFSYEGGAEGPSLYTTQGLSAIRNASYKFDSNSKKIIIFVANGFLSHGEPLNPYTNKVGGNPNFPYPTKREIKDILNKKNIILHAITFGSSYITDRAVNSYGASDEFVGLAHSLKAFAPVNGLPASSKVDNNTIQDGNKYLSAIEEIVSPFSTFSTPALTGSAAGSKLWILATSGTPGTDVGGYNRTIRDRSLTDVVNGDIYVVRGGRIISGQRYAYDQIREGIFENIKEILGEYNPVLID